MVIVVYVSLYSSDHDRGTFLPQNAQLLQKNQPSTNKVKCVCVCVCVSCCTLRSCEHGFITVVLSHLGLCLILPVIKSTDNTLGNTLEYGSFVNE